MRELRTILKPKEGEYAPYAIMYIGLLPNDGRVLQHMSENLESLNKVILSLPEEKLLHRYAEGKWTIKEILLHISDDERIYAYRALRFARGDRTKLPGFEQDDFARASNANERTAADLLGELASVRASTLALFQGLPEESFMRSGVASGHAFTVRAAAYHIAGHELHHLNIIKTRYLS